MSLPSSVSTLDLQTVVLHYRSYKPTIYTYRSQKSAYQEQRIIYKLVYNMFRKSSVKILRGLLKVPEVCAIIPLAVVAQVHSSRATGQVDSNVDARRRCSQHEHSLPCKIFRFPIHVTVHNGPRKSIYAGHVRHVRLEVMPSNRNDRSAHQNHRESRESRGRTRCKPSWRRTRAPPLPSSSASRFGRPTFPQPRAERCPDARSSLAC